MTQDEWKRQLFERVRSEVYSELDWSLYSKQVDDYCYLFGGGCIHDGKLPPHGKHEVWTRAKLEKEIVSQFRQAVEELNVEDQQKTNQTGVP